MEVPQAPLDRMATWVQQERLAPMVLKVQPAQLDPMAHREAQVQRGLMVRRAQRVRQAPRAMEVLLVPLVQTA